MSDTGSSTRHGRAVRTGYVNPADVPDEIRAWLADVPAPYNLDDYEVVSGGQNEFAWAERRRDPLPRPSVDTHRTGTCFDVESTEMREACVDPILTHLAADDVLHEVRHQRSGYHTDLVYSDLNDGAVEEWASLTGQKAPFHDPYERFQVWWYLYEHGPMSWEDAVEDGNYADSSTNRRHLAWLLDHGFAAETRTGYVTGIRLPKLADLHAVELKRRDWETALEQAARANRCDLDEFLGELYAARTPRYADRFGYADYRWVALDAGAIPNALDNREAFEERGVGLLGIAEGGTVMEHIPAANDGRARYTRDRAYVESQLWNRLSLADYREPDADPEPATRTLSAFAGGRDDR